MMKKKVSSLPSRLAPGLLYGGRTPSFSAREGGGAGGDGGREKVRRSSAGERPRNEVKRLTFVLRRFKFRSRAQTQKTSGRKSPTEVWRKLKLTPATNYPLAPAATRDDDARERGEKKLI
jgi:hypothetical protein